MGSNCHDKKREETIVSPTKKIVRRKTRKRVRKHIHPTEVINVNRTIIRNEHYYPVYEREVKETIEENYNCGRNIKKPRCRRY
ncbi:CotD family spore coat protein [Siminovitchia sp. FSL H7-0308]|uniref:Spore coat protein D n=1 Tax=Siminovitchia thermophila TaxID=1245522 RepID=A0ABS2R2B8_9BACI|nr:CotD family spore coat protein [Siminovitchia thermophila]MBM7713520.1 spore coat protein D [Siminovitchia thermophila]ONK23757.1 hypothetical protein BLX87_08765 [Bacillus sp. VT-16-64]